MYFMVVLDGGLIMGVQTHEKSGEINIAQLGRLSSMKLIRGNVWAGGDGGIITVWNPQVCFSMPPYKGDSHEIMYRLANYVMPLKVIMWARSLELVAWESTFGLMPGTDAFVCITRRYVFVCAHPDSFLPLTRRMLDTGIPGISSLLP